MDPNQHQNQAENEVAEEYVQETDSECDEIFLIIEGAYFSDDIPHDVSNASNAEDSLYDGFDNLADHGPEAGVYTPHEPGNYSSSSLCHSSAYSSVYSLPPSGDDPFRDSDPEDESSPTPLNVIEASDFTPVRPGLKRYHSSQCISSNSTANQSPKRFCSRDLNQDETK